MALLPTKRIPLLIGLYILSATATPLPQASEHWLSIARQHLDSYPAEEVASTKNHQQKNYPPFIPQLTAREQQRILLTKIAPHSPHFLQFYKERSNLHPLVDLHTYQDLHLFCGPTTAPASHLLSQLRRPFSPATENLGLMMLLAAPTTNEAALTAQQTSIELLRKAPGTVTQLETLLRQLKKLEPSLLSLWEGKEEPLFSAPYKEHLRGIAGEPTKGRFTNWWYHEFNKRCKDLTLLITSASTLLFSGVAAFGLYEWLLAGEQTPTFLHSGAPRWPLLLPWLLLAAYGSASSAKMVYHRLSTTTHYIAKRLADVQDLLMILKHILKIIEEDQALAPLLLPKLQYTARLLYQKHPNAAINEGIHTFLTSNFHHWTLFFHNFATLATTLSWLEDHVNELNSALTELAYLASLLSLVNLMENHDVAKNQYCYPTYQSDPAPQLSFYQLWHPALPADVAVPNDLTMDAGQVASGLIGPTTGGKTTSLTASLVAVILGQTTAIVPAHSASFTPFSAIFLLAKPTPERSSYQAGLERVKEKEVAQARCKRNGGFILIGADDPIQGPSLVETNALLVAIMEHELDTYQNHMRLIFTTQSIPLIKLCAHDPRVKLLAPVIKRHPNGYPLPLYRLQEVTKADLRHGLEKIGIDIFAQIVNNPQVAGRARELTTKEEQRNKYA